LNVDFLLIFCRFELINGSFPVTEERIQHVQQILAAQTDLAKLHIENWLVFLALLYGSKKPKSRAADHQYSRPRLKSSALR
jgi:hypothetical protein